MVHCLPGGGHLGDSWPGLDPVVSAPAQRRYLALGITIVSRHPSRISVCTLLVEDHELEAAGRRYGSAASFENGHRLARTRIQDLESRQGKRAGAIIISGNGTPPTLVAPPTQQASTVPCVPCLSITAHRRSP
jgi:hypothetical protein